jgi:hemin uptake protein HemP
VNNQPRLLIDSRVAKDKVHDELSAHQPTRVPSEALLGERGELIIVHAGREYRLRRTSLGKLMLTA